jgi:iron complex outermembrane receptor protein
MWAISSRGFNGRLANKILVMVDGRSNYNSVYSGTLWDQNQVPLDQIERIEVIRGAGATMWGADAVDGVISIVTKKAKDTQGTLLTAEAGQTNLPDAGIRFGGHSGESLQYRLDAGFGEHPGLLTPDRATASDRWNSGHGGFRLDWQATARDSLSFDGGAYQGGGVETSNPLFPIPSSLRVAVPLAFSGGDVRARWQHQFKKSDIAFEAYFNREDRAEFFARGNLDTTDFDFQHHIPLGRRNDLVWGLGYRWRADSTTGFSEHADFDEHLFSFFAQDEIALVRNRLTLTMGTRIQDFRTTDGVNFDFQPQVRLLWAPSKHRSVWGAVSRAVRSPSQVERDIQVEYELGSQNGLNLISATSGNPNALPEVVVAYETGYRQQIGRKLTFDLTLFLDRRTGILALTSEQPYFTLAPGPTLILPQQYANAVQGDTRGVEVAATWTPLRKWRLQAGYAREDANLGALPGYTLPETPDSLWRTPRNTADLRSGWDISRRWSVDSSFSLVSRIPSYPVPHYTRVDLRIARKVGEGGELSAGIRNLFESSHLEFIPEDYTISSLVRRDAYVRVLWRF